MWDVCRWSANPATRQKSSRNTRVRLLRVIVSVAVAASSQLLWPHRPYPQTATVEHRRRQFLHFCDSFCQKHALASFSHGVMSIVTRNPIQTFRSDTTRAHGSHAKTRRGSSRDTEPYCHHPPTRTFELRGSSHMDQVEIWNLTAKAHPPATLELRGFSHV